MDKNVSFCVFFADTFFVKYQQKLLILAEFESNFIFQGSALTPHNKYCKEEDLDRLSLL